MLMPVPTEIGVENRDYHKMPTTCLNFISAFWADVGFERHKRLDVAHLCFKTCLRISLWVEGGVVHEVMITGTQSYHSAGAARILTSD